MFLRKKFKKNTEIALDEIFLDSKNIPGFETERFEGKLEFPLDKKILALISFLFYAAILFLFFLVFDLQIIKGNSFKERAANNFLRTILIAAPRGEIYDRNGKLLVWNEPFQADGYATSSESRMSGAAEVNFQRKYLSQNGLSHLLGFVGFDSDSASSPDNSLFKIGKDGIEKYYNSELKGRPGVKITEVDSFRNPVSENVKEIAKVGNKIILSVDAKINSKFYEILAKISEERGFQGAAGIIMDVENGELLAITNFPEYDSEILSKGEPMDIIDGYLKNQKKPFLNRAVSGLYLPGSIIKPLIALAALNEKVIAAERVIMTYGKISLPNPYLPGEYTVFHDWKNHGAVDMRRALAVSADTYFYTIGGGYGDIRGLGISNINKYAEMFNLNKKTGIDLFNEERGIIPYPELKKKTNPEDSIWRIGDTYNASIGQGYFQVTPIEAAVFAAALANKGKILKPRLVFNPRDRIAGVDGEIVKNINIPKEYFQVVQEGMRMAVTEGTAGALGGLKVKIAGKTGTAEIGKKYVNSWFIGFWPYENPRYSIVVVFEKGSPYNLIGGVSAVYQLLDWMILNTPEYML